MSRRTWVVVVARIGGLRWGELWPGAEAGDARDARLSWGRAPASLASQWPASTLTMGWHRSPGGSWHLIHPIQPENTVRCSSSGGKYSENWWVHLAGAVFWALAVLSAQGCECWPSVRLMPSQARRVMGTRGLCNDAGDTSPANKESPMCFTPSSIHLISAMQTWWRKWMLFRNNQRKMLYCDAECWADTKSSFHSVV